MEPRAYSKHTLSEANILVVELTAGGRSGWGEVFCPKVDVLWDWAVRVSPLLMGKDPAQLDALLDEFPSDRRKMEAKDCSVYCHPDVDPISEAFSIALHDLMAQAKGIPFGALLGEVKRQSIPGMPVVTINEPERMAALAKSWAVSGLKFIKVKLRGEAKLDCQAVEAVRAAVGEEISLQVDANGAYQSMDEALPLVEILNRHHVDVIEDLFDFGELELCRSARQILDGDYMVDKDAHWPHVIEVIESQAADLINQHPDNQGRMSYAMKIAAAAKSRGIETAIGSTGFLGIQSTAFQHLASVIGLTRPCEDIDMISYYDGPVGNQAGFQHSPSILRNPPRIANGILQIGNAPGLGIQVDRDALDRLTVRKRFWG